jgi:hypothetical protein
MTVNEARKQLFSKKGRQMQDLPPSQAALLQHAKRATFQSGYCWHMALQAQQKSPCPSEWGWTENVASAAVLACHVPHYVFATEIVCQIRSEFDVNIFDPSVREV